MVDSKCSTEDSYIEVNKGDNVNGDGNDEHSIDAFDEEGGGVAIAPYSKTPAANRKYFVAVVCTFFIGFLAGALAMWFGGSKLGLCSKNIASESRVDNFTVVEQVSHDPSSFT